MPGELEQYELHHRTRIAIKPGICINFHSHNNYQLSFAFAQEVIKLSGTSNRQIIIDGTLGGIGKVAGNLNTELIVDYLVRKKYYDYEFEDILDASYQNERHITEFKELNDELAKMFGEIVETMSPGCRFDMITPSKFKAVINGNRNS